MRRLGSRGDISGKLHFLLAVRSFESAEWGGHGQVNENFNGSQMLNILPATATQLLLLLPTLLLLLLRAPLLLMLRLLVVSLPVLRAFFLATILPRNCDCAASALWRSRS